MAHNSFTMDPVTADNPNVPLLEKEEKKTKLPFCIFLLCNGAVGKLLPTSLIVQELVFLP